MGERAPRHPTARVLRDQESLTPVCHAQAVFVDVTDGSVRRWQDAGERAGERRRCIRLVRHADIDRLAVLSAQPMCDGSAMSKGEHLRKREQATNGRASPLARLRGSYSLGQQGPMHRLFLTLRSSKVKARLHPHCKTSAFFF